MPSLGGCQVQEGCQPQDLTHPPPPSQSYLQPRSVPLSTPSFAPTGSGPHSKPVLRFRQLLAAQAQWGQSAWHSLRPRTSGVRRRSDERARCLNDSERLRSRAARASGCSGASSFPCRWVSTLSRILSHRVAAWTCSVYSLLRDQGILPSKGREHPPSPPGLRKDFCKVISGSVCSVFTVQKRHTTDIHNSWHRNIPLRTTK